MVLRTPPKAEQRKPPDSSQTPAKAKLLPKATAKAEACQQQLHQEGKQAAQTAGVDFNGTFQAAHEQMACPSPTGHWHAFTRHVATALSADMACAACAVLLAQVQAHLLPEKAAPSPAKMQQEPPRPDSDPDQSPKKQSLRHLRGRKAKDSKPVRLRDLAERERPGMYIFLPGPKRPTRCALCCAQFNSNFETTPHYIQKVHEQSQKHQRLLAAQQGRADGQAMTPCPQQRADATTFCQGICLEIGHSRAGQLVESAQSWLQADSPGSCCWRQRAVTSSLRSGPANKARLR